MRAHMSPLLPPMRLVRRKRYKKALAMFKPSIVLVGWMPMDEDWSADIRSCPSVREYILIGEADDGCCGHNWWTWGNPDWLREEPHDLQAW